jgi:hypothetical protein
MRWANVAICVGMLNSTLWVAAWTWFTLEPPERVDPTLQEAAALPFATQPMAIPSYRDFPELETLPALADDGAGLEATWTRFVGRVLLTDVGNGVRSLSVTLEEQSELARRRRRTAVLWLVAADCDECNQMARQLELPVLQRTFRTSLLVRVDAEQFASELAELQILEAPLPGFGILSDDGTPVDFLHAGEWRAQGTDAMAPILETFVKRRPFRRRFPWRGGPHPDETPI